MTAQPNQARGTKFDQRIHTKEEPVVRHEELSAGQVRSTRDREMAMVFIYEI